MINVPANQLRTLDRLLRQRDPQFARIVAADNGHGVYEIRAGLVSHRPFTFDGDYLVTPTADDAQPLSPSSRTLKSEHLRWKGTQ